MLPNLMAVVPHGPLKTDISSEKWGDRLPVAQATEVHQLDKRSPPRKFGPIFRSAGCLGCQEALTAGKEASLDKMTVQYLMSVAKVPRSALRDTCLCYTSITPARFETDPVLQGDQAKAGKLRLLGLIGKTPRALSKHAARYACDNGLLTLWVSR